jgi:putative ABC transport system permease protein
MFRILKQDFGRKKGAMLVVFAFITLSAMLLAGGAGLIVELNNSITSLFEVSKAPHFVQMHAGELDSNAISAWAESSPLVHDLQLVEMVTMDGSVLYLDDEAGAENNSIMDISFVRQNKKFDFLLDMQNRIVELEPGEIGIPLYYMERRNIKLGDSIRIRSSGFRRDYVVAAFIRDALMNPSIVHSKRFLVHESDFDELRQVFTESEYLVEFQLTDPSAIDAFSTHYTESGLPQKGPALDLRLFRMMNSFTDGMVAAVVILLSILLMMIAILCLRLTILAAIEDDYHEIGVLKAVGMARKDIRNIYLLKYIALAVLGSSAGYLASLPLHSVLAGNILLYLGKGQISIVQRVIPLMATGIVYGLVVLSSSLVFGRFKHISAVEALRSSTIAEAPGNSKFLGLHLSRILDVNVFLGIRDVVQRFKVLGLLSFIFFFCTFTIMIPVHLLSTIKAPSFISYMGIGRSDIRIDLRQSEGVENRFASMLDRIAKDEDVKRFAPLVTAQYTVIQDDGERETMAIETGDFDLFPLNYLKGREPSQTNEIALSYLNAKDKGLHIGDTLVLLIDGTEKALSVCGIYQDVTNGGRTAKAILPYDPAKVLWYNLVLDFNDGVDANLKASDYSSDFHPARITDLDNYLGQTFGKTIAQIGQVTMIAILVGLFIAVLITSLFLKMLIIKDTARIAILKSVGFSVDSIRLQYLTTAIVLLGIGLVTGTLFSNTAGQELVSFLGSFMGASQIRFMINGFFAYLLMPVLLLLVVSVTTVLSIQGIKECSVATAIAE